MFKNTKRYFVLKEESGKRKRKRKEKGKSKKLRTVAIQYDGEQG